MFDKQMVSNNIRQRASEMNIKLGDLETRAGMTAGYLSKWSKDESKSANIVNFLIECSKILNISLDSLLQLDFSSLSPNQKYLVSFFDKVIKDTNEEKLSWNIEYLSSLKNILHHPLFEITKRQSDTYEPLETEFKSQFRGDIELYDDCFNVEVNNHVLYLMRVRNTENSHLGYELYFVTPNDNPSCDDIVDKLCDAYIGDVLYGIIESIYTVANESSKHVKIDKNVKSIIDDFMNEIPF